MSIRRRIALVVALGALLAAPTLLIADDDPPKLAGTWTWKWKDSAGETHRHVLEIEGIGTSLSARERFDDKAAVKVENLKLEGKTLSFAVTRDDRRAEYKGTVAAPDTINGLVNVTEKGQASEFGWTATREAGGK